MKTYTFFKEPIHGTPTYCSLYEFEYGVCKLLKNELSFEQVKIEKQKLERKQKLDNIKSWKN